MRVKFFPVLNSYVDLDHILSISQPRLAVEHSGPPVFIFQIQFAFVNEPKSFGKEVPYSERSWEKVGGYRTYLCVGSPPKWIREDRLSDELVPVSLAKLRKEIEELVEIWKGKPLCSLCHDSGWRNTDDDSHACSCSARRSNL